MSLWMALFLALYLLLAFFVSLHSSSNSNTSSNLDMLKINNQFIYGQKVVEEGLSFTLNEQGEAALFFQKSNFQSIGLESLQLQVEGLNNNYQVDLVWKNKADETIFEQQLLQPNGHLQINLLRNNPNWGQTIEQLGLRFSPHLHLGLTQADSTKITIKALKFQAVTFIDAIGLIKDYWFEYDAWSYKSINHNPINRLLPIYAQPLFFIFAWLLLVLMTNMILKRNSSFLLLIIMVWLVLDVLFISDMRSRSSWANEYYSDNKKVTLPDQDLIQIVNHVKSVLDVEGDLKDGMVTRIIVLSNDRYQRARLVYHLLPLNSGFIDFDASAFRKSWLNPGDYILSYDAARNPMRPDSGQLRFDDKSVLVKEMVKGQDFILMKVLRD